MECHWCFFSQAHLRLVFFYLSNPTDLDTRHATGFIEGRDMDFPVCPQSEPNKIRHRRRWNSQQAAFPFEKIGLISLIQHFHRFWPWKSKRCCPITGHSESIVSFFMLPFGISRLSPTPTGFKFWNRRTDDWPCLRSKPMVTNGNEECGTYIYLVWWSPGGFLYCGIPTELHVWLILGRICWVHILRLFMERILVSGFSSASDIIWLDLGKRGRWVVIRIGRGPFSTGCFMIRSIYSGILTS